MKSSVDHSLMVRAELATVWAAFTEPAHLEAWHGHADVFEPHVGGRVVFRNPGWEDVEGIVEEVVPMRLLRWRVLADGSEVTETFRRQGRQTKVRVTHGPGSSTNRTWADNLPALELGWLESLADLALYVEHGVRVPRHMAPRSTLGARTRDTPAGIEIVEVGDGGFATRAGLQPGDVLVQVGRAPLFDRSDLALLLREHRPGTRWEVTYVRAGQLRTAAGRL